MNHHVIGIDSARAGWITALLSDDQRLSYRLYESVEMLWRNHFDAELILIDIPIGLASDGSRRCDQLAREQLGIRRSSVFTPPVREAIYQADYLSACIINERVTGRRISKQAWNISAKIREVDRFLLSHSELSAKILEAHPELNFAAFSGHPMKHNKKTKEGFDERYHLLFRYLSGFEKSYRLARDVWKKSQVTNDDLLDASVLALAASRKDWHLWPLPDPPEYDDAGLPMQIIRPAGLVIGN